ncbi:hypothetical protein VUR80DRAFT_208 [Thermomyces stellatus]
MEDTLAKAKYAAMVWNIPLSESHANDLLERLNLPGASSIVDIGCGWGELLLRATALSGPDVKATGIDIDQDLLGRAKRNAEERKITAEFVQQRGADFRGTADRAICLGSSHVLGGTRAMLSRLAEIVPRGRVLVGDMFWERPPTEEAKAIFGDEALPLADLAALCREAGWEVLYLTTADQREWDDFESCHRAGPREWLLENPEDPAAADVREEMDRREREYLTVYRGVVGYAFLVLGH